MDRNSLNLLEQNNSDLADFFKNGIVIFDSSALLDLYNYPVYTRQPLFEEVFSKIKGRLWIPSHVEFEYLKNREKVIKKPINVYENLIKKYSKNKEGGYVNQIGKELKDIKEQSRKNISGNIQALKEVTKNADKHPHIDHKKIRSFDRILNNFDRKIEELEKDYDSFCAEINIAIKSQIDNVNESISNDDVLKYISKNFEVGESYDFERLIDLCKIGQTRYSLQIPPGYDDDEKTGMQKYGDYILWAQVIDFASSNNFKIVLVTNDSKSDWWEYEGKRNIEKPRIELLKEFSDKTNQEIYITNSNRFYREAKKYLELSIDQEILDTILESSQVSRVESQLEAEMTFFEWLSYQSRFENFSVEVNIGGQIADIVANDSEGRLLVFEVKRMSSFNKPLIDDQLRIFLRNCQKFIESVQARIRCFVSFIFNDEVKAIEASKYLDMYVVEARIKSGVNNIHYHVIVGFLDKSRYKLIYSDYNMTDK